MEVLVFGNALVKEDDIALQVADALEGKVRGVSFRQVNSLAEKNKTEKAPVILDVAKGIKKVEVISDERGLAALNAVSAHDLDLAFELKLFKKTGMINSFRVIALPFGYGTGKAAEEAKKILVEMNGKKSCP